MNNAFGYEVVPKETVTVRRGNSHFHSEYDRECSGKYTSQQLKSFRNKINARVLHAFSEYNPAGSEDDEANKLVNGLIW